MRKKEKFSSKELVDDLISAVRHPPSQSKKSYIKNTVICLLLAVLLVIASYLWLGIELILLALALPVGIFVILLVRKRTKHAVQSIRTEDYSVESVAVLSRAEETYFDRYARRRGEWVSVYTLHFDNGKSLKLPKYNFSWSKEYPMSDTAIYHCAAEGSHFYLVCRKDTGEAVLAYPKDYFVYEG